MAPLSRLGRQIAEVTTALQRVGAPYALIGGLALASHHVIRATQDVDLLTDFEKADEVEALCPTWPQRETFLHMHAMLL
jgi:hypothetical protein